MLHGLFELIGVGQLLVAVDHVEEDARDQEEESEADGGGDLEEVLEFLGGQILLNVLRR